MPWYSLALYNNIFTKIIRQMPKISTSCYMIFVQERTGNLKLSEVICHCMNVSFALILLFPRSYISVFGVFSIRNFNTHTTIVFLEIVDHFCHYTPLNFPIYCFQKKFVPPNAIRTQNFKYFCCFVVHHRKFCIQHVNKNYLDLPNEKQNWLDMPFL